MRKNKHKTFNSGCESIHILLLFAGLDYRDRVLYTKPWLSEDSEFKDYMKHNHII